MKYKCTLLKINGKCADQAEWKEAQSGQYLCCLHATTSFLLMTRILCVAGRIVPLDDYSAYRNSVNIAFLRLFLFVQTNRRINIRI